MGGRERVCWQIGNRPSELCEVSCRCAEHGVPLTQESLLKKRGASRQCSAETTRAVRTQLRAILCQADRGSVAAEAATSCHEASHLVKETKKVLIRVSSFPEDVDPGRVGSSCLTHFFWLGITKFPKSMTPTLTSFVHTWVFPSDSIPTPSHQPAWCSCGVPGWKACAQRLRPLLCWWSFGKRNWSYRDPPKSPSPSRVRALEH